MTFLKEEWACFDFAITQWKDFPEENSKGPHVTLAGVHFVEDALRSHPL